MTYWQAVKCLYGPRARALTKHEQIMRNLTISIGNLKFATVCIIIATVMRIVKIIQK